MSNSTTASGYTTSQTREYFAKNSARRIKLHKRNRYYYWYIDSMLDFFVPKDAKALRVTNPLISSLPKKGELEYISFSDVLGYIHDVQSFLTDANDSLAPNGRIVITQYSALWEPVLRLASALHLRMPPIEQNWLSLIDLKNFLALSGFEVVKS